MALKSLGADQPSGNTGSGSDICPVAILVLLDVFRREESLRRKDSFSGAKNRFTHRADYTRADY